MFDLKRLYGDTPLHLHLCVLATMLKTGARRSKTLLPTPYKGKMDLLNICWRGMAGAGKRRALQARLAEVAMKRGLPFSLTNRPLESLATGPADDGSEAADEAADIGQIMAESSLVHMGFDIARMSMKDKQVLIPILSNLGSGSQVLSGQAGRGARILVFYNAHLLSSESVLLLQSCLEMNEGDVSIWMTSEMPVPQRIRDWFVEVPVAAPVTMYTTIGWPQIFHALLRRWSQAPPPTIEDVKEVKAFVYELLMRNLRWVEAAHFLLDVFLTNTDITDTQRLACVDALAACEATAGGYTIPSYRIPILWESLFLQIRNIVSAPAVPSTPSKTPAVVDAAARPRRTGRPSKKSTAAATS
jgi:hypothetical protein